MRKLQYSELATKVADDIKNGILTPGTRLPTHRAFAESHGVALATATRAYNQLQKQGFILGEAGRGMFVRDPRLPVTLGLEQSENDEQIDLVFNMPSDPKDPEILRAGLKRLAASGDLEAMLRYQPHGGRTHERKIISTYLSTRLGQFDSNRLFITSGGQHGLMVSVLGLLKRGDVVGTDCLTYPGFKAIVALHGLTLVPVEGSDGSIDLYDLERQCREKKLRAIYLMPTVHNPLGYVMDETNRRAVIEVARRYDLLIIEDGAYDFLETDSPPSFLELAPDRTIYVGSFSKVIATGLRIGYLIVPENQISSVSFAIRATTWNAPALISSLVTHWIEDGLISEFEENRRTMGAVGQKMCRTILGDQQIISHRNASFVWLPLGDSKRAEPIIANLSASGVAVSSAEPYGVTNATPQALRLAFGGVREKDLRFSLEKIRDEIKGSPTQ